MGFSPLRIPRWTGLPQDLLANGHCLSPVGSGSWRSSPRMVPSLLLKSGAVIQATKTLVARRPNAFRVAALLRSGGVEVRTARKSSSTRTCEPRGRRSLPPGRHRENVAWRTRPRPWALARRGGHSARRLRGFPFPSIPRANFYARRRWPVGLDEAAAARAGLRCRAVSVPQ